MSGLTLGLLGQDTTTLEILAKSGTEQEVCDKNTKIVQRAPVSFLQEWPSALFLRAGVLTSIFLYSFSIFS
jgi:hypothetical protein